MLDDRKSVNGRVEALPRFNEEDEKVSAADVVVVVTLKKGFVE